MNMQSSSQPLAAVVRPANAADNAGLLALVRRCTMDADISLIVERDPDFFALSRARGDTHTSVAEIDGVIVGCFSSWRHDAWLCGSRADICYVGDLRVAPEHRRRGIARQLADINTEYLATLPVVPYLGAAAAGNAPVESLAAAYGAGGPALSLFTSWQLLPMVRLKIPATYDIGAAGPGDEGELVALLDDFYRQRDFSPVFGGGGLANLLARSPGMQLCDYLIARRRGRIAAAIGVWDASSIRRTRVAGMPLWLRAVCTAGRAASRFVSFPPFPQPGALLRFRYIRHAAYAAGEMDALRALVRWAANGARARDEHFLLYTCADDDPLRDAVAGAPRLSFHYGVGSGNYFPQMPALKAESAPRSWYFDDAALA